MRPRLRLVIGPLLAIWLAGCAGASPSVRPSAAAEPGESVAASHAAHSASVDRVKAALAAEFLMAFEPAGPHHQVGRAPDGVELDLVGIPVEEVVLSLHADDRSAMVDAGLAFLPHLRDLVHGPARLWHWAEEALICREDPEARCDDAEARGAHGARLTESADYVLLIVARR